MLLTFYPPCKRDPDLNGVFKQKKKIIKRFVYICLNLLPDVYTILPADGAGTSVSDRQSVFVFMPTCLL